MTEPVPLLVPVQVDALVVNDQVRLGENFQRWQANYALTRLRLSPEPPPFSNIDTDFALTPGRGGVYLQWQLPQPLTSGHQNEPDAEITFPLVPNRWLVVRTHGEPGGAQQQQSAWIVESDHLDPVTGSSPYATRDGSLTRIGRRIDLSSGAWTEPGPPEGGLFLTTVGPGVPTFAVYQPYNTNVFSIHDTMDGLDRDRAWTVSYLVVGWYSDPDADPLTASGTSLEDFLADWAIVDRMVLPDRSLYHGTVLGLTWHATGPAPQSPRPDRVEVALGNTSAHAAQEFLQQAEPDGAHGLAALLSACQHGLLDDADEPDAEFKAARTTFTSWFTPTPAGHAWTLEEDPDAPEQPPGVRRRTRRALGTLLTTLNADQAAHDEAARDLAAAQRRLYDLWWAAGLPVIPDYPESEREAGPGSYRADLMNRLRQAEEDTARCEELLAQARAKIPWGRTPDELAASIADKCPVPKGFVLKRDVLPATYRAGEPVVLLRHAKEDQQARLAAQDGLRCRRPGELLTAVYLDSERTQRVSAPDQEVPLPDHLPDPAGLSGLLTALLREFFHLDPANAPALARAAGRPDSDIEALRAAMANPHRQADGTVPALGTTPWRQPWSPLFFQWEVDYYPITYAQGDGIDDPGQANWAFDGNRYQWLGTGADHEPLTLRGRQFLTPTAAQSLADGLRNYAGRGKSPFAQQLRALAEQAGGVDFISQTLDGFNDQLLSRSPNPAVDLGTGSRTRREAVAQEITRGLPPDPGPLTRPFSSWPASRFQQVRSGQFAFTRLNIVDRFGRALPVVIPDELELRDTIGNGTPAHAFRPALPHDVRPGVDADGEPVTVVDRDRGRFVETKPRLPQPARTHLTLLSALDDTRTLDDHTAAEAICAWLVPNHLDRSLLCYAPDGAPLGTVTTSLLPNGSTVTQWQPLPHSLYLDSADLEPDHRHLHDLVTYLLPPRERATLHTLLRGLDRALTTIAPSGDQPPPPPWAGCSAAPRARPHPGQDRPRRPALPGPVLAAPDRPLPPRIHRLPLAGAPR